MEKNMVANVEKFIEEFRKDLKLCEEIYDKSGDEDADDDKAILRAIETFNGNTNVINVHIKATLINSLYGTNIFSIDKMAKHISKIKDIDLLINEGRIEVIDSIRKGHGIKNGAKMERDLYSFATKYANWHAQDKFPIYDRLVSDILYVINKKFPFCDGTNSNVTKWSGYLRNYVKFKEVIDKFCETLSLDDDYKKIDKALWAFAKIRLNRLGKTKKDGAITDNELMRIKNDFLMKEKNMSEDDCEQFFARCKDLSYDLCSKGTSEGGMV